MQSQEMFVMPPTVPTTYIQTSRNTFMRSFFFFFLSPLFWQGYPKKASHLSQHIALRENTEEVVHGQKWLWDYEHTGNLKILVGSELPQSMERKFEPIMKIPITPV